MHNSKLLWVKLELWICSGQGVYYTSDATCTLYLRNNSKGTVDKIYIYMIIKINKKTCLRKVLARDLVPVTRLGGIKAFLLGKIVKNISETEGTCLAVWCVAVGRFPYFLCCKLQG